MAKRLTDPKKWDDDWYLDLSPRLKCAWTWICDKCDGIGVQKISFSKLSREIGETISREEFELAFCDRIVWLSEDTFWIAGFISQQYKGLYPTNRAHVNIARKCVRTVGDRALPPRAKKAIESLQILLQQVDELRAESGRSPDGARAESIGNRKQEIGNRKELEEGGVGETSRDLRAPTWWPFQKNLEVDAYLHPDLLPELTETAAFALSTVPRHGQEAWVATYRETAFIRKELNQAVAHLANVPPKRPYSTFAAYFGNWLKNNWDRRVEQKPKISVVDLTVDPLAKFRRSG